MKFPFKAKIDKAGINPCVKVPLRITNNLKATKGYIPIKGKIQKHFFQQTLCPVKGEGYRLYVNGPMMKGADVKVGQTVHFVIEQDTLERNKNHPMPKAFKKKLEEHGLLTMFQQLAPSRQKEINRYLNNLKTEESLARNINKMIAVLKGKTISPLFRINKNSTG
ncbi:MAG TPA: YdeI/OmpD-associated family protein [Chitinophagaceae bacterium]|nr:YdeI/OmpD-associated family protein [Chitinophagaceae bacterium]